MMGRLDPDVRSRLRLAFMNRDFTANDYEMLNQLDAQNARYSSIPSAIIYSIMDSSITSPVNLSCTVVKYSIVLLSNPCQSSLMFTLP